MKSTEDKLSAMLLNELPAEDVHVYENGSTHCDWLIASEGET